MAKQLVPGNNAISIDESGWVLFKRPHGTFYSVATQAIAATNATQVIALEKHSDVDGLKHSLVTNNSRVYVPTAGSYEFLFSGICDLTLGTGKYIEVFPAVDGTPVPESNTRIQVPSASIEMTVVVSFIYDMAAGQYFEWITYGDDTNLRWLTTAAGGSPDRPVTPSVITTVKKISSRLSYA